MRHLLTFDLGSTYLKVCLFDETGQLLTMRRVKPPSIPATGASEDRHELSPEQFCDVLSQAVFELRDEVDGGLSKVAAISFATQANSFVLMGKNDQPITPIILWSDNRANPMEPLLAEWSAPKHFNQTTGLPRYSGQFFPAKLRWIRKHQPEIWEQAQRFCLISDYLTLWLTGMHVTEAGTAGLSGVMDVHHLRWWSQACRQLCIPEGWLPQIARAGTSLGPISADISKLWGLPTDCRFVIGCLDQYAGAIGAGNVTPGGVSETTGTVLATVRCADHFDADPAPDVFQGPGLNENTWYQMSFGSTSANILEAFRNHHPDKPGYDTLCEAVTTIPRAVTACASTQAKFINRIRCSKACHSNTRQTTRHGPSSRRSPLL